tara:strand:+ start:597 stop:1055 length:459 start_codon:yes stop_codon:yes gene_type:complete
MKKLAIGISLLFCLNAMSQSVPKNIESAFKKQYPSAMDTEWTSYLNSYEIVFSEKDIYKTAILDIAGNWIKTISQVDAENIPQPVMTYVTNKFGDAAFDSAEFIETKTLKYYNITVIDEEGETSYLTLDATGKIVTVANEVLEEEAEEDDEE